VGGEIGEATRGRPAEGGETRGQARALSTGEHGGRGPRYAAHDAAKHARTSCAARRLLPFVRLAARTSLHHGPRPRPDHFSPSIVMQVGGHPSTTGNNTRKEEDTTGPLDTHAPRTPPLHPPCLPPQRRSTGTRCGHDAAGQTCKFGPAASISDRAIYCSIRSTFVLVSEKKKEQIFAAELHDLSILQYPLKGLLPCIALKIFLNWMSCSCICNFVPILWSS